MTQRVGPILVLLLFALGCLKGLGQTESSLVPLRTIDDTQIESFHLNANGFGEIAGDQAFYVEATPRRYLAIDLDRQTHPALDLDMIPATDVMSPKDLYLVDVAPDPRGGVLGTLSWSETPTKSRTGVVRFDRDGDYEGLVWLDTDLTVTHAVAFSSSGNFLVVGYDDHWKIKVRCSTFADSC